jgi:predicted amidohydrolase YtcJ
MAGLGADWLMQVGTAYSMTGQALRAIAGRGDEIVGVSEAPDGLDDLVGAGTRVADAPELTVLPAFEDAHEHLLEAARNTMLVPVGDATSVAQFQAVVRAAAERATEGEWVLTSMAWHESNLAQRRLPTRDELDAASPGRPVLARRGGHLAVANSAALHLAGIDETTSPPPGGGIGRDGAGPPNGALEGAAVYEVMAHAPPATTERLVEGLRTASRAYAALGVGTVREAMISVDELGTYQAAHDAGALSVRARPLIRVPNDVGADAAVGIVEGLGLHSGFGDDWLRVWGLKVVLDGGVEGGAMEEPSADDPSNCGHLNWERDALFEVCLAAVRRGWRVGAHAAGDRAVQLFLDVCERVTDAVGRLAPATLVIEHALVVSPQQQERAVRLGLGITVQHALLWNMGSEMLTTWGAERTARVGPVDEWLARGAILAAGTDIVRPFNPMTNVWGMVTRGTRAAGVQGPQHAIERGAAIELYTAAGARLDREGDRRGAITPGYLADLVAYEADPYTIELDALPALTPRFTLVGGRPVHDPASLFGGACDAVP